MSMSRMAVDYTQTVDYVFTINRQLDRIAEARSNIIAYNTDFPEITGFIRYLSSVEALYALLLKELRGNAAKYLGLARKAYNLIFDLNELLKELDGCPRNQAQNQEQGERDLRGLFSTCPKDAPEKWKRVDEIKADLKAIKAEIGNDGRAVDYPITKFHLAIFVVDRALEEMITRLDQAGLLIKGRKLHLGVANVVSSGTH